jgi:hypothetical protein
MWLHPPPITTGLWLSPKLAPVSLSSLCVTGGGMERNAYRGGAKPATERGLLYLFLIRSRFM